MTERVGIKGKASCGMEMTILEYRSCDDIDVQFADGSIVQHRTWASFQKGKIAHPAFEKRKSRIGESCRNKSGMLMTIIRYKNRHDMDIQFEDGTILRNRDYHSFESGKLTNPNVATDTIADYPTPQIGDEFRNKQGFCYKIIGVKGTDRNRIYRIQFEDGAVRSVYGKKGIYTTQVSHPRFGGSIHTENDVDYSKPSRITNMDVLQLAYIYQEQYNFYCKCPYCGQEDILTIPEVHEYVCPCGMAPPLIDEASAQNNGKGKEKSAGMISDAFLRFAHHMHFQ